MSLNNLSRSNIEEIKEEEEYASKDKLYTTGFETNTTSSNATSATMNKAIIKKDEIMDELIDEIVDLVNRMIRLRKFQDKNVVRLSYTYDAEKYVFMLKTIGGSYETTGADVDYLKNYYRDKCDQVDFTYETVGEMCYNGNGCITVEAPTQKPLKTSEKFQKTPKPPKNS